MKRILFFCVLAIAAAGAFAEVDPPKAGTDPRIRTIQYDPLEIVRMTTFYGMSTQITFAKDESIKKIYIGDDQAWDTRYFENHMFLRPKAVNPNTNMQVITSSRVYQFVLTTTNRQVSDKSAWADKGVIVHLNFTYPTEAVKVSEESLVKKELDTPSLTSNDDYWVAGSDEISPSSVKDDGRFIYLTFSKNRDIPAVYIVDEQGNESLVNVSFEGKTMVVQRMSAKLILRKGEYAVCLVNKSFNKKDGIDTATGTVSNNVTRDVRKIKP